MSTLHPVVSPVSHSISTPALTFHSHLETLSIPTSLQCSLTYLFCIHYLILIFNPHHSPENWPGKYTTISAGQVGKHTSGTFPLLPKIIVSKWWTHQTTSSYSFQNSAKMATSGYGHHSCIIEPSSARKGLRCYLSSI